MSEKQMKRLAKFARVARLLGSQSTLETIKRNFKRTMPSRRGAGMRESRAMLDRAARAAGKQSEVRTYLNGGPLC